MLDYKAPDRLLEDRIILVTGAGDGIGRCAARTFAAYGATTILLGRTLSKLESVYDEIEEAGGPKPALVPLNLEGAAVKDYQELAITIEDSFGRLDGILHNAGLLGQLTPIELYAPETWDQLMKVNVTAPFLLTQALIPIMRQSKDASVVFTASSVGRKARAYWGAYAVSKFALEGLSQLLADELDDVRHNIRVNSLNPGATRTNMRIHAYPGEHPDSNPWPEEIMPAYLYLMGADSQGVTGQQLDARPKKAPAQPISEPGSRST